jgi:hypothetical protein
MGKAKGWKEALAPEEALKEISSLHHQYYRSDCNESFPPSFMLYRSNGPIWLLYNNFSRPAERDAIVGRLRRIIREAGGVYMYSVTAESWCAHASSNVRPSKCENREEIIWTIVEHRDGRRACGIWELVRDWATGRVTELKEWDGIDVDSIAHRFDLFEETAA